MGKEKEKTPGDWLDQMVRKYEKAGWKVTVHPKPLVTRSVNLTLDFGSKVMTVVYLEDAT